MKEQSLTKEADTCEVSAWTCVATFRATANTKYHSCVKQHLLISLEFGNPQIHLLHVFFFNVIFSPHLHVCYKTHVQAVHTALKTLRAGLPAFRVSDLSRERIAMNGEKKAPTRAHSGVSPGRCNKLGKQWSNNRQGKGYEGKAESRTAGLKWICCEGTGWSNRSSYPAQSNKSPKTNSPAASRTWLRVEHGLAQCTASCTYTWHSPCAWLMCLQKVSVHSWILVEFVKLKQSFYCWTAVLCQCLLTLAKKHPSVSEQLGTFKFNDDNEYAKEVITTRKA